MPRSSTAADPRDVRLATWESQVAAGFRYREWVERARNARSGNAVVLRGFQVIGKIREAGFRQTAVLVTHRIRREIAERRR